jgi:3-isopropylmalate/(R)-2-methylmalate dehydratase small subunit
VLTRANFGCGSSREHAPWALEVNGINLVVAESFARIFRQNMYNCGMLAVEVAKADLDALFAGFAGKDTTVAVDLKAATLSFSAPGAASKTVGFKLGEFENALVQSGGWVEYAAAKY